MRLPIRAALIAVSVLSLTGCAAQLAPPYDQAISGGLAGANSDIQALFVGIGTQVAKDSYASRGPAYDHIVAELKALDLQIRTRPTPNPDALEKANQVLSKLKIGGLQPDPNFSDYPSARAVDDLTDTIQHMQMADQAAGLRGGELKAFENQAITYLSQAITYENFLKR
jgi:hypothetical protein